MCAPSRVSSFVRIRLHIKDAAIIIVHNTAKILLYRSMSNSGCIIFPESFMNFCHSCMPYSLLKWSLVKPHVSPSPSSPPLLGESPEATLKGGGIIKPLSPGGRGQGGGGGGLL